MKNKNNNINMNNSSINHLKRRLFISAVKRIETKYCRTKYIYDVNCINNLIFNDSSRVVALFKDFLIISDNTEFLRRFYSKDEATPRLRKIVNFYETYSKIFPNYMVLPESRYLYKNIRRKQKMIDAVNEIKREEEENRKKIAENNKDNTYGNVYSSKKGMYSNNKQGGVISNNNVFTEKVQQSINKYHPSFSVSRIECNDNESGDVSNYMQYVNFNNNNNGNGNWSSKAKYKSNNNRNKKDNDSNEMSISLYVSKYKKVLFNNNNNNNNSNDINLNINNETNISIVDILQLLSPSKTAKDAQHTKRISSNGVTINNNNNTKRKKTPHRLKQPQSKKPTKTHLQLHKSKKNIYLNNIDHNNNTIHKQHQHQQQHHPTITANKSKSQRLTTSSASTSINKVTHNVYNNYQNIIIKNQSTGNTVININNNYYQYQTVSNDNTKLKQQQTSSSSKNKSKQSSTAITSVKTPRNGTKHTTVVKTKPSSHTTTTIANKHYSKSPLRKSTTTTTRYKSTAHTKSNNVSSTVHNATISSAAKQRTRPIISVNPSTSTTKSARKPLKHTKSLYTHFTTVSNVNKASINNNNSSNTLIRSESVYTVKSKYLSTTQSVFSPRNKGVNAVVDDKALTTALRCKYKAFLQKMKSNTGRYVGKRNSEGLFGNNSITTGSASSSYRGSCTNRNYLTTLISNSSVTNINLKKSVTKQIFRDISSTHVGKQHANVVVGNKGGLSPNMSGNGGRNSNIGVNSGNSGNININNSNSTNNVNNNWRGSSFEMMQVPNLKMKKITVNRKGYTKRGN